MLTKIKSWSLVLNQISWAWRHPFFWMNKARKVHSLSSHTASSLEDQCRSRDNRKSPVVALWFGVWRWGRREYKWKEKVVAGGQLRWRVSGRVQFRKKWWCQWQCYETRIIWATVSSAAAWATSCCCPIRRAERSGRSQKQIELIHLKSHSFKCMTICNKHYRLELLCSFYTQLPTCDNPRPISLSLGEKKRPPSPRLRCIAWRWRDSCRYFCQTERRWISPWH